MKKTDGGRVLFATIKTGIKGQLLQIKISACKMTRDDNKTGKMYTYFGNWYLETYQNGIYKTRKHINGKIALQICERNNLTKQFNIIFN